MTEYVDTWHLAHTRNDRSLGQGNRDPATPKGKSKNESKNESKNDLPVAYCVKTRKSENDTRQNEDEMSKLHMVVLAINN